MMYLVAEARPGPSPSASSGTASTASSSWRWAQGLLAGSRWSNSSSGDLTSSTQAQQLSLLSWLPLLSIQPSGHGPGGGDGSSGSGKGDGPSASTSVVRPASKEPVVLTLASFAVTKLAYVRLTKKFREVYFDEKGIDVRFRLAFAGSGVQARAVIDGLPADLIALALPLDIQKVVDNHLIEPGWRNRLPNNAVVCETTAALVVRDGNPKNIKGWDDLVRPDVTLVMANPKTAGVARWIFLALWGHRMKRGDDVARKYVTSVVDRVVVQPRDAREASDVFYKQKVGDVLLTYENEVILTNEVYGAKALPYIIPQHNIRIECPVALVDNVVNRRGPLVRQVAEEFSQFLFTAPAQKEFAKVGFRVNPKVCKEVAAMQVGLPPCNMWSVDKELGGWDKAQAKFFDAGEMLDQIQAEVGRKKAQERKDAQAAQRNR